MMSRTVERARNVALAASLLAFVAPTAPAQADSCSAGASVIISRSDGGTCPVSLSLNDELTFTYRMRNASIVDGGANDGTPVQSTILAGAELVGTLAQETSSVGSPQLPGVLTFVPVCPAGSVGGSLGPGDECDPNLAQCGSAPCGCVSNLPGVTCTAGVNPNKLVLAAGQDIVFAGGEQKTLATIRVRVTGLVGLPAVCGEFFTRIDSTGDIVTTTDALCDTALTAGAQASANLHASLCQSNADCGDPACNVCADVATDPHCEPANLGSACGDDENATDCATPACVNEGGVGVCSQAEIPANEGGSCDNNDGVPVDPANCQTPICTGGVCDLGPPLDCDDDIDCTTDSCDPQTNQCQNTPDDDFCDDDTFCNGVETCDVETGCEAGSPPVCDDGVECTDDVCDPQTDDCAATPNDDNCDNDAFCDGDETCDAVDDCQPGTPPDCDDQIPCTTDSCNEATDACAHAPDNSVCQNGLYCDGNEICSVGVGCVPGIPVPCNDQFVCTADSCVEATDSCAHDFSPCVCGDNEVTGSEVCDPPVTAGTFEDCNNGVDDDRDGDIDCRDRDCRPNGRGPLCDEGCELDLPCQVFIRDPARIVFDRKGGPDEIYLHGRIPKIGDFLQVGRGAVFEVSNQYGPIYRAELGPGDLKAGIAGRYFRWRDRDAETLGEDSLRGGLSWVRFRVRRIRGVEYIVFTLRAYANLSAANHFLITTKLSAGPEVGFLTAEWQATPRGWLLHQKDFAGFLPE